MHSKETIYLNLSLDIYIEHLKKLGEIDRAEAEQWLIEKVINSQQQEISKIKKYTSNYQKDISSFIEEKLKQKVAENRQVIWNKFNSYFKNNPQNPDDVQEILDELDSQEKLYQNLLQKSGLTEEWDNYHFQKLKIRAGLLISNVKVIFAK